jgi:hypothetical protein
VTVKADLHTTKFAEQLVEPGLDGRDSGAYVDGVAVKVAVEIVR